MSGWDAHELVRWAEMYGHPEEWAKAAQNTDARAERAEKRADKLAEALEWIAEYGTREGDLLDEQRWTEAMRNIALNTLAVHRG